MHAVSERHPDVCFPRSREADAEMILGLEFLVRKQYQREYEWTYTRQSDKTSDHYLNIQLMCCLMELYSRPHPASIIPQCAPLI